MIKQRIATKYGIESDQHLRIYQIRLPQAAEHHSIITLH